MKCPNCGAPIKNTDFLCPYCGVEIDVDNKKTAPKKKVLSDRELFKKFIIGFLKVFVILIIAFFIIFLIAINV